MAKLGEENGIGVFCIVERRYLGLVSADEPHALRRGQAAKFRIQHVLPDGKLELSLRGHGHEELERDAQRVLKRLSRDGAPRVGDHSSPEQVRALFGLSKKAFKRAAGRLLREGHAQLDREGFLVPSRAQVEPRASSARAESERPRHLDARERRKT